jgi:hypothetical protein
MSLHPWQRNVLLTRLLCLLHADLCERSGFDPLTTLNLDEIFLLRHG